MIKVNKTGLEAIRAYLLKNHKIGAVMTDNDIKARAVEAEKDDRAQIDLLSWESVSGHTEVFALPDNGFDIDVMINE